MKYNVDLTRKKKTPTNNKESVQKRNPKPTPRTPIPPNRRPHHSPPKPLDRPPTNTSKNNPLSEINPENNTSNP